MAIDITERHPVVKQRYAEWLEAWDFYRGGRAVTNPGRTIALLPFLFTRDELDDSGRLRSRFEDIPVESYLWSHVRETVVGYNDRKARAVHAMPVFQSCVETYASATLKIEPRRARDAGEPWLSYWDDVDRRGTNIGAFIRQALTHALVFGFAAAVTDMARYAVAPASFEQQQADALSYRAYSYLVSPLSLINYKFSSLTGQLDWVVIEESAPDMRIPGEQYPLEKKHYRVLYVDHWELRDSQNVLLDAGEHTAGEVPVSLLFARRSHDATGTLDADSILSSVVRGDRALFNQTSLLHEQIYKQCFSQTYLPMAETGAAPGAINVGPDTAIAYDGAAGTPIMLSPNADVIRVQIETMLMQVAQIKEQVGLGRGRAESSKEERSADALLVETRNESNRVASLAEATEEFDRRLHRHVAAMSGAPDYPKAEYSRDVSLRGLEGKIARTLSLQRLGLPEAVLQRLLGPLIEEHLRDSGEAPERIAETLAELERSPALSTAVAVVAAAPDTDSRFDTTDV